MKKGEKDNLFRIIFLIAAVYDFVLGILFLVFYKSIYNFLGITLPVYPMYMQMAAAFVIAMGVGYYFVYKNLYRNIDLVKLGVVYKAVYSGLAGYFYLSDLGHVIFFWFAIIDIIFLLLFVWFLVYAKSDARYKKWR
ncbi:hypothetical protein GF386_03215 [Candidatus Pacearchaeota archaeon]|nr:hypothetical protein [Candidatus Pacearchaeota archaeon]MBD3283150.1 hypothetical protein [Candidatus Pacearchaeota archaeon]